MYYLHHFAQVGFVLTFFFNFALSGISLNSCDSNAVLRLNSFNQSPNDIRPGTQISIYANWNVTGDINQPIKAVVQFTKNLGFARIQLPCINNIGSCTYNDICHIKGAPPNICSKFARGTHNLEDWRMKLPTIKNMNVAGNYEVEVRLVDGASRNVGCWKTNLNIK